MNFRHVIVGAGLTGCTLAERIANERGERVLVVEQRDHIGGNTYDEWNDDGLLIHRYGPHIFHTNSERVWTYLSRFTEWRPYEHRVLGNVEGRLVPVPFNIASIEALFPAAEAARLCATLLEHFRWGERVPILNLRARGDEQLKFLADYIYANVFEAYTRKQWGVAPESLSPSVTARVPVVVSRDDRYFPDRFQAMPLDGYTRLVGNMLRHPRISVLLGARWQDLGAVGAERVFYTGPIDELLDYELGPLPYRSLRFESRSVPLAEAPPAATVNHPNTHGFTRVTDMGRLAGRRGGAGDAGAMRTTLVFEHPQPHVPGRTLPYYPIPDDANRALYDRYRQLAERRLPGFTFLGRLADYQYFNMDQAVARALKTYESAF